MSAIDLSTDTPSNISTAEQAFTWLALLLYNLHRGRTYKEAEGNSLDPGQAALVDVSQNTTADGNIRLIIRASIALDEAYVTDTTQKLWQFAQEFGQTDIPGAYRTD